MKPLAIVLLVVLLILVLLPLGMGMVMGCPLHAATCAGTIGMCLAVIGLVTLLAVAPVTILRDRRLFVHAFLLVTALDKPPRFA